MTSTSRTSPGGSQTTNTCHLGCGIALVTESWGGSMNGSGHSIGLASCDPNRPVDTLDAADRKEVTPRYPGNHQLLPRDATEMNINQQIVLADAWPTLGRLQDDVERVSAWLKATNQYVQFGQQGVPAIRYHVWLAFGGQPTDFALVNEIPFDEAVEKNQTAKNRLTGREKQPKIDAVHAVMRLAEKELNKVRNWNWSIRPLT